MVNPFSEACRDLNRTRAFRQALAAIALALVALTGAALAQEASRPATEALARRAAERMRTLEQEADRLASQERTLLGDLRRLDLDRQIKAQQLQQIVADSDQVARELAANGTRIQDLERRESTSRPEMRARLVQMYKLGHGRYARLLLSTSDARQVGQATRVVTVLAKLDRERLIAHQRTLDELKKARGRLEERRVRLAALKSDAERAQVALDRAARARADLIRDIDSRRDLNAQLVSELQAAQQKLQGALRTLASGASAEAPALPLRPFRGDLDWPVNGTLRRRFGQSTGGVSANGIDIAATEGLPVAAVHDGVVAFAEAFSGFGNLVIIDHGSRDFTLYGDLLDVAVKKGERVERGHTVGRVGPAPAGQPELYFELRIDGQSVDPLQWLKRR